MKIGATADLHGFLPEVPSGLDLLLVAGDVGAYGGDYLESFPGFSRRLAELDQWILDAGCPVVAVAGNHDFTFERAPALARARPWTYLEDELVVIEGLAIYGTPWVPTYGPWAFMAGEDILEENFADIPSDIDVLITHGPSSAHGGVTAEGVNAGSTALERHLYRLKQLQLHVFGHIHEAFGTAIGNFVSANVAHVGRSYKPTNAVQVFTL